MLGLFVTTGRVLLALFFVISASLKIKGGMDAGSFSGLAGYIASRNLPQPLLIAYAVIAFEIIAGMAIIFGVFTMPVALLLAAFCLVSAGLFHNFWAAPANQFQGELNNFLKNIGLAGAFLTLAGEGIRTSQVSNVSGPKS